MVCGFFSSSGGLNESLKDDQNPCLSSVDDGVESRDCSPDSSSIFFSVFMIGNCEILVCRAKLHVSAAFRM